MIVENAYRVRRRPGRGFDLLYIKVVQQLKICTVSDAGPLRVNTRCGSSVAAVISDEELSKDPVTKKKEMLVTLKQHVYSTMFVTPVQTPRKTKCSSKPLLPIKFLFFFNLNVGKSKRFS